MNQRKPNISRWYALGLAVVLVMGCLVMSVGVTWARYRTETNQSIFYQARKPLTVYLGKMEAADDGGTVFNPAAQQSWEMMDGSLQLDFAVANGTSLESFETDDQRFHIRMLGSLGAWSGDETAAIHLVVPSQTETAEDTNEEANEETTEETQSSPEPSLLKATTVRIEPNTQLWNTFGDGWVFCFLDPGTGEELVWTLEGGALSCLDLAIAIEGGTLTDTSLLQLQILRVPDGT